MHPVHRPTRRSRLSAFALSWLALLAACPRAPGGQDRVALQPVMVKTLEGEPLRPAFAGERFRVHERSFLADYPDDHWEADGDRLVPHHEGLVRPPITGARRYVRAEGAVRYATQRPGWVRDGELLGGAAVDVAAYVWDDRRPLLRDGEVIGWVKAAALVDAPVPADLLFDEARKRFTAGDLDDAQALAHAVRQLESEHVASATRMEAAIRIHQGEAAGWVLYGPLAPTPMPAPPIAVAAAAGERAVVAAGATVLRDAADARAPAKATLPSLLWVDVLEVKETWARVEPGSVAGSEHRLIELGPLGRHGPDVVHALPAPTVPAVARTVEATDRAGWVPLAALDQQPPDTGQLLASAERASAADAHELAAVLFERHFRLSRVAASKTRARAEAIDAARWLEALRLGDLELPQASQMSVAYELSRFAGCRGDRRFATVVALDDLDLPPRYFTGEVWAHSSLDAFTEPSTVVPTSDWPADACVARLIEPFDCEAADVQLDAAVAEAHGARGAASEEPVAAAEAEAPRDGETAHEREARFEAAWERKKGIEIARRVAVSNAARRTVFAALLEREIPAEARRSTARLHLINPTDAQASEAPFLVFFEATFWPDTDCAGAPGGYRDVVARLFNAPALPPHTSVGIWFESDAQTIGVARFKTRAAADRFMTSLPSRRRSLFDPWDRTDVGGVVMERRDVIRE